jgi:hypothetical protein
MIFHRRLKSWNFASDALICPEKAKQELEPLGGLSLSYKTRTKDRIDKGLVYPNAYCSITTTTMKSILSNTAWYLFCFFRAYKGIRCKVSWSVWAFPLQMKMTFCRQSQGVHKDNDTEQTPHSNGISFGYGKSFVNSVFMSLAISDLHYLQGLVPDNCRRKLLSAFGENREFRCYTKPLSILSLVRVL